MEQRNSFVFYRSFFEAVSELKPKAQTEVILAICEYALNRTERQLSGMQKAVFILIKPNLDANQKKYENGKKGGRPVNSQNQTECRREQEVRYLTDWNGVGEKREKGKMKETRSYQRSNPSVETSLDRVKSEMDWVDDFLYPKE